MINTSTWKCLISYANRGLTSKNGYLSGLLNNERSKASLAQICVAQWCSSYSSTERSKEISEVFDF